MTKSRSHKKAPGAIPAPGGPAGGRGTAPDLNGKRVTIVGFGRTGEALADFLLSRGSKVIITDTRRTAALESKAEKYRDKGAAVELGRHTDRSFRLTDLVLLSPGVPSGLPQIRKARSRGIPITGEIELASRFLRAPMVAVTGTNGKSTTTSLTGELLRASGRKVFVGGNIGHPLIGHVHRKKQADVAVVELSSFQLETAISLKPAVSALLNVTPDHLDRYADAAEYFSAKTRIFERQDENDVAVMNADDVVVACKTVPAGRLEFSRKKALRNGAYIKKGRIVLAEEGRAIGELPLSDLKLIGGHNHENVMAALLCATAMGADPAAACRAAAEYRGLPHRIEFVGEYGGVRYYNDSKGTNAGAVIRSVEGFRAPVVLIAGGRDKDSDFRPLKAVVRKHVKALILLGEAAPQMERVLGEEAPTVMVGDMAEAVAEAARRARPGNVVLLSPACASFDMFENYGHRGREFTRLVKEVAS